jgi:predicted transcriptional regulator
MEAHITLVKDLLSGGLTQQALGDLLGKSQAWVGAVLAGKYSDIKWGDAEAIRKLHAERCQKAA